MAAIVGQNSVNLADENEGCPFLAEGFTAFKRRWYRLSRETSELKRVGG